MTDRDLLERAAKAAGMELVWSSVEGLAPRVVEHDEIVAHWNPLTDDGDALRLAVKLHLIVDSHEVGDDRIIRSSAWETMRNLCREPHNGDPYAATRRAIVRAAAELAP